ncbi:MAG TPA: endonuclease III [Candidatus Latescibacteria bacterium]|jgi:endonuclease-3|nr:endonuclease III [Candidatus Latescibacterota bacterium]
MQDNDIHEVIDILQEAIKQWPETTLAQVADQTRSAPFRILIGTVLSLRTKDETTAEACKRLFSLADSPETMVSLSEETIDNAIYPVGFHTTKAKNILAICRILIDEYNSLVPDEIDILVTLPGVGRKTANLVVTLGYDKPGICVDTHVHRISNRWGYVNTKNPEKTESALREKLPQKYWIGYNDLLVIYGQNLCKPISPFCSRCRLSSYCDRVDVEKYR